MKTDMADWCSNRVIFYADKDTRRKLGELFRGLAEKEKSEYLGQLPPFLPKDGNRFTDIRWADDEEAVYYKTRWEPNIGELVEVANFYGCAFECTYKEPMSQIFGRVMYRDGSLSEIPSAEAAKEKRAFKVIDLNGDEKKITDLDAAIAMTAEFKEYRHEGGSHSTFDKRMHAYWADLNAKLRLLRDETRQQ